MRVSVRSGLLAFAVLILPTAAHAARSPAAITPRTTATLVTDTDDVAPGQPFQVALELRAAPGWHTYWRNPGDAGAPTTFDLDQPATPIAWPLPERIPDGPVMSFGYTRTVLLTRTVTPRPAPLTLTAHASWLVCEKLCVPESATLSLTLPAGQPAPSADAGAIAQAAASVPKAAPWPAYIAPDGTLWLTGPPAGDVSFLPDASDTTVLGAPQTTSRTGDTIRLKLTPTAAFRPGSPLPGVLVLGSGARRIGYTLIAEPAPLPPAPLPPAPLPPALSPEAAPSVLPWSMLGLALLGGLLLNLMPCVFPVLAMKAIGLASLGGGARRQVRGLALSYTAGVLLTFLSLGALLLILRAAGAVAGWGFQFQYPAFVAAMAWLFFAIGLGFSGVWRLGAGWTGLGQGLASRHGHAGSFATGLLAVLVATPCTAPFMGVAIAAATTAKAPLAMALFAAMATGFAAPTLLLAAAPGLAARLPRPGAWMERLQQGLAFPMYAAAVWLVWVQSQETGSAGVLGVGTGFVLIALAIWLNGLAREAGRSGKRLGHALALGCLFGALAVLPGIARSPAPALSVRATGAEPFTTARLQQLRQSGRPVLVNMTASWCVTCLVNERAALRPALPALAASGIAYLTGDWTRQDPTITVFLRRYGRDGVPLYVFFPPGNQPGRVLPQLLTPRLLAALPG